MAPSLVSSTSLLVAFFISSSVYANCAILTGQGQVRVDSVDTQGSQASLQHFLPSVSQVEHGERRMLRGSIHKHRKAGTAKTAKTAVEFPPHDGHYFPSSKDANAVEEEISFHADYAKPKTHPPHSH